MIRATLPQTKSATFCVELPNAQADGMPTPTGTGFFVSADGWFVTAAHVVAVDGEVRQDLAKAWFCKEGRPPDYGQSMCIGATCEYVNKEADFALLRIDFEANRNRECFKGMTGFPFISVSLRPLEDGEPVYSFGYPLSRFTNVSRSGGVTMGVGALSPRTTSAIVASDFEESKMIHWTGEVRTYVLDKALNYGNSGGPIVATSTGHVHAFCSRFQPVMVPQPHLKDPNGNVPAIMVPSLYGVVSSLGNREIVRALNERGIALATS